MDTFRIEENDRMDRREQAKQQQKQARLSQSQSERDNELPKPPLFGVPKKVRIIINKSRQPLRNRCVDLLALFNL